MTVIGLSILLLVSFGPLQIINAETVDNNVQQMTTKTAELGTWGNSEGAATWTFDNGVLTINGGTIGNSTTNEQRPWQTNPNLVASSITSVVIADKVTVGQDATQLFAGLSKVTSFTGMKNLDTSQTTNMTSMFNGDGAITSLDLSSFTTDQVTNMANMFMNMGALKNVDLSNWVISANNSVTTLIPTNSTGLESLTLKNTHINKTGFKFYARTVNFINLGSTTLADPTILREATTNDLVDAVNEDSTTGIPGSLGVWLVEPKKVADVSNYNYKVSYWSTLSDVTGNTKREITVAKEDTPIYVGVTFEVPVEQVPGYTAEPNVLVLKTGGSAFVMVSPTASEYVYYTRPSYYEGDGKVTIPSNIRDLNSTISNPIVQVENPTQYQVGDTFTVPVPEIPGYTADKTTVTVKVTSKNFMTVVDGVEGGADFVNYTESIPEEIAYLGDGTVKISSNLDQEIIANYPDYQTLKVGDIIEITVPDQSGYNKDKTTVKAIVKDANTIEIIDPETEGLVTYTKKNTGGNGGGTIDPEDPDIEGPDTIIGKNQKLAVYSDLDGAKIYDSKGQLINNRQLAASSAWHSDQIWTKMAKSGQVFYRVASNEWVKAEDVYVYENTDIIVHTKTTGKYVTLVDERGETVKNRALAIDTKWQSDRIIELNGQKYYRVATHEFVSVTDVDII